MATDAETLTTLSLVLSGPVIISTPTGESDVVLRKQLSTGNHVHFSFKDRIESYILEFCIGMRRRVGHASNFVAFAQVVNILGP